MPSIIAVMPDAFIAAMFGVPTDVRRGGHEGIGGAGVGIIIETGRTGRNGSTMLTPLAPYKLAEPLPVGGVVQREREKDLP